MTKINVHCMHYERERQIKIFLFLESVNDIDDGGSESNVDTCKY